MMSAAQREAVARIVGALLVLRHDVRRLRFMQIVYYHSGDVGIWAQTWYYWNYYYVADAKNLI